MNNIVLKICLTLDYKIIKIVKKKHILDMPKFDMPKVFPVYAYLISAISSMQTRNVYKLYNFASLVVDENEKYVGKYLLRYSPNIDFNDYSKLGVFDVNIPSVADSIGHLRSRMDFEKYLLENLEKNRFIAIIADRFYLPGRPEFEKRKLKHVELIVGYDKGSECCYILTYKPNLKVVSYKLNSIYDAVKSESELDFLFFPKIKKSDNTYPRYFSYKYVYGSDLIHPDKHTVIAGVESYLKGDAVSEEICLNDDSICHGVSVVKFVANMLEDACYGNQHNVNYRDLMLIREHKYLMYKKIKHFNINNSDTHILKKIENVLQLTDQIYFQILENFKREDVKNITKIRNLLLKMHEYELEVADAILY